jgi:hypothetical protein
MRKDSVIAAPVEPAVTALEPSPVSRDELTDIRENQLRLKREMDSLRDELFARDEEEAIIVDEVHVVTDRKNSQTDSEAKRAWDARAKHLKQVR